MSFNPQEILGSANILVQSLKTIYSEQESKIIPRWLVEAITKKDWTSILLNPKARFTPSQQLEFNKASRELLSGRPIQYVIGEAHFYGHIFKVEEAVLIPRGETEELVEWIIHSFPSHSVMKMMDIGTGSGCIPITLSLLFPQATVTGVDISSPALKIARYNNAALGAKVNFRQLDVLHASPEDFSQLDLLISNPPYVLESERDQMHRNVLEHEPELALFVPDEDALLFYRQLLELGKHWLNPGGWIYFEINEGKGGAMLKLMEQEGYQHCEVKKDLNGKDRMARCQLPG